MRPGGGFDPGGGAMMDVPATDVARGVGVWVGTVAEAGGAVQSGWGAATGVAGKVRIGGGVGQAVRVRMISGCVVSSWAAVVSSSSTVDWWVQAA